MSTENTEATEPDAVVDEKKITPTWPQVVELKHPITFAKDTISTLTFRRGTFGDIRGMKLVKEVPIDDLSLIASRMCGVPVAALHKLADEDAGEVMSIVQDFYVKCLAGGRAG